MTLTLQQPLRFEPFFRATAWGGRRLALPRQEPAAEHGVRGIVGSEDHPSHASVVATGTLYGHRCAAHGAAARRLARPGGGAARAFSVAIKLLDIHDLLSVQVHPDAARVRTHLPGECSKTEAWLVLDTEPGSVIYAGLRPGVGPAELRAALEQGAVAECLHRFTPQPGDFLYLPAGTVHAAGGGVLLAEIQETSDVTFRLYDWSAGMRPV